MKKLETIFRGRKARKSELLDYLKEKKIHLPESMLIFFLEQNPIKVQEYYYRKGSNEYYLDCFYPFDTKVDVSFQSAYENLNDFLEGKYIAFAGDPGGWEYVLSMQEGDFGKVYLCRMDQELNNAITLIANSFEELINALTVEPV